MGCVRGQAPSVSVLRAALASTAARALRPTDRQAFVGAREARHHLQNHSRHALANGHAQHDAVPVDHHLRPLWWQARRHPRSWRWRSVVKARVCRALCVGVGFRFGLGSGPRVRKALSGLDSIRGILETRCVRK